jgi:hypothetical protein
MATAATIKKNIAKLEAALKSKATPKSLKSKLETQLVKSKAELSGINKGAKPKTSTSKSAQTALQKLKEMVNKNKKLKTYKKSGVDLEKDADRPALPIGRRTAKQSGKTYYEYRANRIDVKQPPKRYPKLEKGGYMAKGGMTDADKAMKDGYVQQVVEIATKAHNNGIKASDMSFDEFNKEVFEIDYKIYAVEYVRGAYQAMKNKGYAKGGELAAKKRLEELREELRAERISYGELAELQELSEYIDKDDVELLEAAGVPENDEDEYGKGGKIRSQEEFNELVIKKEKLVKNLSPKKIADMWNKNSNSPSKMTEEEAKMSTSKMYLRDLLVEKELTKAEYDKYFEKGGYMAKGGETKVKTFAIVDENTDRIYIKNKDKKFIELKYKELKEIYPNDKLSIVEFKQGGYMAKGGYFAKGGAMEHGLKRGDTIIDDMFFDNSVKVLNNKTGYAVVHLETGERKEMKAMGGEMHRTQE